MPFLIGVLQKLLTDKVLGELAVKTLHEAARRSGKTGFHEAIHLVAPLLGVELPKDLKKAPEMK